MEIKQVADPICANACGAAWIAAVGPGELPSAPLLSVISFSVNIRITPPAGGVCLILANEGCCSLKEPRSNEKHLNTAVCSTRNLDMVRSLGADHVIDYKKEDFRQISQRYGLIIAVNGYHPFSDYLQELSTEGTYVVIGGSMLQRLQAALQER